MLFLLFETVSGPGHCSSGDGSEAAIVSLYIGTHSGALEKDVGVGTRASEISLVLTPNLGSSVQLAMWVTDSGILCTCGSRICAISFCSYLSHTHSRSGPLTTSCYVNLGTESSCFCSPDSLQVQIGDHARISCCWGHTKILSANGFRGASVIRMQLALAKFISRTF